MGLRVKWDLGDEPDDSALDSSGIYGGDVPPKGMYRCRVVGARVKDDKNGDPRVNFWIEIQETSPSKKQFNGYRFYDGQTVCQREIQQKIWKQLANALRVNWRDIGKKTVLSSEATKDDNGKEQRDVVKFAGVAVDSLPKFNALCKVTTYKGNERLEITRWLPLSDEDVDDEADSDLDDDEAFGSDDASDEPPF